jgi:hypothetical protein
MKDPFLLAHQAGRLPIFNLAGRLSPISIRDQMIRGRMAVERAMEEGLIQPGPGGSDLLVLGAGACGATAAIRAADLGVRVSLIDAAPMPYLRQALCRSRWIDPTQYDWPLDHWNLARFPWGVGGAMPLPWTANRADRLAMGWLLDLVAARRRAGGLLGVHMQARVAGPPTPLPRPGHADPWLLVPIHVGSRFANQTVGAMIVAVGFGLEDCKIGNYRGFAFWETDQYEQPNCGLAAKPHVVISGSGDGALQDFLRIMTGRKSAAEIVASCGFPAGFQRTLLDCEQVAQAAMHWGASPPYDHPWHQSLQLEHLALVRHALGFNSVLTGLQQLLANRPASMTLVHRCTHLTGRYALNRFLVLLIAEYIAIIEKQPAVIEQQRQIDSITPLGNHQCGSPTTCHGQNHEVQFRDFPACSGTPGSILAPQSTANVVLIRHGVVPAVLPWLQLTPHVQPRQILPYYLH